MAKENSYDKPNVKKTPKEQLIGLEAKFNRLQKNPEKNKEEIERLKKEAARLIDLMDRLEKEELAKMAQENPKEAAQTESELSPLVEEAKKIKAQLAELDNEEAGLDTRIAKLEAELNNNTEKQSEKTEEEPAQTNPTTETQPIDTTIESNLNPDNTTPDVATENTPEENPNSTTEAPQPPAPEKPIAKINIESIESQLSNEIPNYGWGEYNFVQVGNELVVQFVFKNGEVLDIAKADRELSRAVAQGSKIARNQLKNKINASLDKVFEEAVDEQERENAEAKKNYDESSEAQKFISDFGLQGVVPEAFNQMTDEQQLKTIQDLKNKIVDTVKREARLKYNKNLQDQMARSGWLGKIWNGIVNNFQKELDIKKQENEVFEELKQSPEFERQLASDLEFLTNANKNQIVIVDQETGGLMVDYTRTLKRNPALQKIAEEYNKTANTLRTTPYEWGQAAEGSTLRNGYDKVTRRYEEVHAKLVAELSKNNTPESKQDLIQLLQTYNQIKLDQFLSQHPDANMEFAKLGNSAGASEFANFVQRMTGTKTAERTAILIGGMALRGASKMLIGWVAAPVVGAITGALRGRARAKEDLNQKRELRRYGGQIIEGDQETSEKFVDAKNMVEHIGKILSELEKEDLKPERKEALQKRLSIRTQITLDKLDLGLINFGDTKESLANQYFLIQKLNEALATQGTLDPKVKAEIENRATLIMAFRQRDINEAQGKYIKQQMIQGAKYGAGLAAVGFVAKAIFDHVEAPRNGGVLPEVTITGKAPIETDVQNTTIDSTRIQNPTIQNLTPEKPDTLGGEGEPPVGTNKDILDHQEKTSTGQTHINKAPGKIVNNLEDSEKTIKAAEVKTQNGSSPVHTEAVVKKGEGVTFAFKQQIKADPEIGKALAKQIGYEGRIGTQAFYKALGEKFGYIDEKGDWIGVKGTGEDTAYQFEKKGGEYVVTEYHKEGTEWVKSEMNDDTGKFEGKDFDKKYEYLGKGKQVVEKIENNSDQLARPIKQGDLENEQLARPEKIKTPTDESGQLARAPKEAPVETKPLEEKMSTKDYWSKQSKQSAPAVDDNLYGEKKDVNWGVAPGPGGRPWIVEDFKLEGGKAIRLFADRFGYQDLTNKEVNFVGETYRYNLNRIFARSEDWTEKLSMMSAPKLLRMDVGETIEGDKEELSTYIKMLNKETGIKPFNDGWVGNKETAKDYILRMLLDLEYKGKLDAFNDKFDAFMKGR